MRRLVANGVLMNSRGISDLVLREDLQGDWTVFDNAVDWRKSRRGLRQQIPYRPRSQSDAQSVSD
jgi:hypothetical protein